MDPNDQFDDLLSQATDPVLRTVCHSARNCPGGDEGEDCRAFLDYLLFMLIRHGHCPDEEQPLLMAAHQLLKARE